MQVLFHGYALYTVADADKVITATVHRNGSIRTFENAPADYAPLHVEQCILRALCACH
jgi:hypothetical protein